MNITFKSKRDKAFELVDEGIVSPEQMMRMALSYMSADDVEDMLDANELSERFLGEDDECEDIEPFPTFILSHPSKPTIKIDVSQDPEGNGGGFLFQEMLKKSEIVK